MVGCSHRLLVALAACVAGCRAGACHEIGAFRGSEDATLLRAGLALQSSGLVPGTQPGLILAVSLLTATPAATPCPLVGLPAGFGFRPHGLHLDNATKRLFAVSHSDENAEETIVAFDVADGDPPSLRFRFALTSAAFRYYGAGALWFLNDVAAVDGEAELYVTQFGPQLMGHQTRDKALLRCTWDEADARPDGRLPAACGPALPERSLGLNGVAIDPSGARLWVNDLYESRLWVVARGARGNLTLESFLALPGVVDNVEYDRASGDLAMGLIGPGTRPPPAAAGPAPAGGALVATRVGGAYAPPRVAVRQDAAAAWQVSTSLVHGNWTLLGSPWDAGPIVCAS